MYKSLELDGRKLRLNLREEDEGGILNINGSHIVFLNETATFYTKMIMEELDIKDVIKRVRRKYRVSRKQIEDDYKNIYFNILTLATRRDVCPFSLLGVERVEPFSAELKAPYRFDLALTYRCNNNCDYCYTGGPREMKELTTEEWERVIRKAEELEVPTLVFTGGEAILRDDLAHLLDISQDFVTGLITNGRLLTKDKLKELDKVGLDFIQISLESADSEIHNKMVGVRGAWEETVEGLRNAIDTLIYTTTNTTLTQYNKDGVLELLDFLHSIGVQNFSLNSIIRSGRGESVPYALTSEELDDIVPKIKERADEKGMRLTWFTPTRYCEFDPIRYGLGIKVCSAAYINVAIEPDGRVIPCQSWLKEGMGYILEDNWDDIWNSDLAKSIRKKEYMPEECADCPRIDNCSAGCPLDKYCASSVG